MTSKDRSFIIILFIVLGCAASPQSLYDSIESVESKDLAYKFVRRLSSVRLRRFFQMRL
jgi:hypothetical protein